MGFGRWGRDRSGFPSHRVWMFCLVLGFMVAIVHLTASQSSSLAKSFRGLHADIATLLDRDEKLTMVAPAEHRPPFNGAAEHGTPFNPATEHGTPSHGAAELRPPLNCTVPSRKVRKLPRIAICLVGGARSFELTGLSIKKHVLDVYNRSDIFLHVPLDSDAHKLTLLKGASKLAMARVFENEHVTESFEAQELLTAANSPNGIQGLLQYFRLVEGCLNMISTYETKYQFEYDWIIRTRVDGYWNGPLPPLRTLHPRYYHVPYGSKYGGLNDRLGIGTRNTSWPALSRLGLIPKLHEHGYRALNSEAAFKRQLDVSNVSAKFDDFRFCILTSRRYAWPLSYWGVPVASIMSTGALNGAKCKPCHPVVSGEAARAAVSVLGRGWGWIRPVTDLRLCDSSHVAEPRWQSMFDKVSGPQLAHVRHRIMNRTLEDCIREVHQFGRLWENWDAPTAELICRRHDEARVVTSTNSSHPEGSSL